MIYTSGVILRPDIEETLEQLQDNKLAVVCSKLDLKPTDKYVPIKLSYEVLSELHTCITDFLTLVVVGELSSPMLRRITDARLPVLPLLKINTNLGLNVLLRME